jgi:DNA repair exonuclease SbcCD ATPase subunit
VKYCDLPGHTRAKAFAARREFERGSPGGSGRPVDQQVVADRPVSYGRASFEALLSRFEQVADEHRDQLGVIVAEAEALIRTVSDADAVAFEVEEAHRAAEIRIGQAQTAQAAAERAAGAARREAAAALEDKAQADAAAEETLAELEAVRTQTADQLAQYQADAEHAQADQRATRAELEEVRAAAAKTIAEARDAAEQHKRETIAERDRVLADMRQQIEQARADAHVQVTAMQDQVNAVQAEAEQQLRTQRGELADATSAATRAQAEQAAAERAAELDRAAVAQLRLQLDTERADHHREITETRREAHDERAALTRAHAEQLTAVLATIGQTTGRATDTPPKAPEPQARRARGKEHQ